MIAGLVLSAACAPKHNEPRHLTGADPDRGLKIVARAGCAACHQIPGVRWPQGRVGGSLAGFGQRALIAGRIPNQPDALVRWLQDPAALAPTTGMPPTPLTRANARDVAAYLYTLHD